MNRLHPRFSPFFAALLVAFACSLGGAASLFAQDQSGSLQQSMSPEEFKAAGLEKLTPAELGKLNAWIQGNREKAVKKAATREKLQLVVSRVDGVIRGIGPRQIIPLEDGTQWEITDRTPRYDGPPKDHPATAVYKSFFGWKIRMAGVGEYYVIQVGKH